MDSTDVLIFCEMSFKYFDYPGKNRRPSPRLIGSKLGLDERTVRIRTRRMEHEGFIQYYQTIPNLCLFDRPVASLCNFRASSVSEKQRALEKARDVNDVIDISDFLGETFGITISGSSDEDLNKKAARIASQINMSQFQLTPPRQFPTPRRSMEKLDWQLVQSLRYDALRPTKEIADDLGITYRMAEYRLGKLFESLALSTRAIINARDPKGIIFYSLNLSLNAEKSTPIMRRLRASYGNRLWWHFNPPGPTVVLFLFATSIGRAEDDLLQALHSPGVRDGSLTVFKGWVEPRRPSWIDGQIGERIEQLVKNGS